MQRGRISAKFCTFLSKKTSMVIFERQVPGTRPKIQQPLSPEIDLGTRPEKVLKEALERTWIRPEECFLPTCYFSSKVEVEA